MKFLHNLFETTEPHFEKGGRFAKWYPFFEAIQSFAFSTKNVTKSRVHVRDSLDTKRYMSIVLFSLKPVLFFGIYNAGYQAFKAAGLPIEFLPTFTEGLKIVVPLIIVSYVVGLFWEFLFAIVRGHEINEGFLVTGLLYPLILPPTIPLWQAAIGITFGVIVGKEVFGGTGRNFLNPALTARAFVFFAYPAQMSGAVWTSLTAAKDQLVDGFSGATALAVAAITPVQQSAEQNLIEAGFSLKDLFIGFVPGSVGETSVLFILMGAILLLVTGVGSWRTMLGSVLGATGMVLIFNTFAGPDSLPILSLSPAWHLSMGGFAFATVFMATDPVSSPSLQNSRFVYGLLIGILGVIIRCINPAYPEGWMLAILLMNVFAPLIDHVNLQRKLKKRIPNVV
jgi:Na+-transporting NADH:ubiquinone oxidoreductase subunit B